MPINSIAGPAARPIGTCQGLNSPHSPRMVTIVKNGNRQLLTRLNILTQLPTPLDCISSADFLTAEPSAADSRYAFFFGGQRIGQHGGIGVGALDDMRAWPLSGT